MILARSTCVGPLRCLVQLVVLVLGKTIFTWGNLMWLVGDFHNMHWGLLWNRRRRLGRVDVEPLPTGVVSDLRGFLSDGLPLVLNQAH